MPKKTFFRLPAEKQQRLLKAAHAEFSRVPFNEASVSNIIKAAEIPRGSFYQYFEDKADIFFYDLSLLRDSSKQDLEQLLLDTKVIFSRRFAFSSRQWRMKPLMVRMHSSIGTYFYTWISKIGARCRPN